MSTPVSWNQDNISVAVRLWDDGQSMSQIAAHFGVTRNTISGMIYRNRSLFEERTVVKNESDVKRADPNAIAGLSGRPKYAPSYKKPQSTWTEAKLSQAADLWLQGVSSANIAEALAVTTDSLNSAIRRNRSRFPARSPERMRSRPDPVYENTVEFERSIGFDLRKFQIEGTEPIPFIELNRNQCRFTLEELRVPGNSTTPCCGQQVVPGKSYCPSHMKLIYRKPETVK